MQNQRLIKGKHQYISMLLISMFLGNLAIFAQSTVSVSGYIQDRESGEVLRQARIVNPQSGQGVLSNEYGFFSIECSIGNQQLVYNYSFYKADTIDLYLQADTQITLRLLPYLELETVEITDQVPIEQQLQMSTHEIPMQQIKQLPAIMGEVDILKAVQLMPGVTGGNEGTTGLHVRGGSADQNLILLDGVPLYYVNHLGGFFSIFPASAINQVKLIKGGFPARYGGRTSSVLDIRMKEGNQREMHGEAALGIVSAQMMLEGPLKKDKSSFLISARRTYLDVFTRAVTRSNSNGDRSVGYNFYDITAKVNYHFSDKSKLYLSTYLGDDKVDIKFSNQQKDDGVNLLNENRNRLKWGNQLVTLRWNRIWSKNIFSNLIATYTRYRYRTEFSFKAQQIEAQDTLLLSSFAAFTSGIKEYGTQLNVDYYPSPQHHIKTGFELKAYQFNPGISARRLENNEQLVEDSRFGSVEIPAYSAAIYVEDQWKINDRLGVNMGLRANLYYADNQRMPSLEPRLSIRYLSGEHTALKFSVARMSQFTHQLSNSDAGIPTDLWVPATSKAPIQSSWITALGIARSFQRRWEFSYEVYYKKMQDLIDYQAGETFWGSAEDWQDKIVVGGTGESYGGELFLHKKSGKTQGWLSYTLSWSQRSFRYLNQGIPFPYKYDNRHNLNLFIGHTFSPRFQLSGLFTYKSGNAVNLAVAKYNLPFPYEETINSWKFGEYRQVDLFPSTRNGFRIAPYHRLDISANFSKEKKWGKRIWNISIYNLYGRKNPYFYFFQDDRMDNGKKVTRLKQFSLFPIIPSISYKIEF